MGMLRGAWSQIECYNGTQILGDFEQKGINSQLGPVSLNIMLPLLILHSYLGSSQPANRLFTLDTIVSRGQGDGHHA